MKKNFMLLTAILLVLISVFTAYSQAVTESFVRFHILADSNSAYDQLMKINLRNHILKIYEDDLKACNSKEETLKFLNDNLYNIEAQCNLYLKNTGCNKKTDVTLKKGFFPKKAYEGFTLPCGNYDSLKITVGSGKGKNFFCVMFPPACVSKEMTGKVNEILNGRKIIYKIKLFQKGV